ncbi:RNA 2'-phosphotransferase [Bacillus sp. FJAT-27264]|nr:RNA 2'-phosphotransferase [Bacillus sp. FJAT-27264]
MLTALRHAPWEYQLKLDPEGWVRMEQLLSASRLKSGLLSRFPLLQHIL